MPMKCSMLESAEDYANEWQWRQFCTKSIRWFIDSTSTFYWEKHFGFKFKPSCFCDGGLPMIKPDCPKHGHLTRHSE